MFRRFSYRNNQDKWRILFSAYTKITSQRYFYVGVKSNVKMFVEHENKFAYDVMTKKGYAVHLSLVSTDTCISKEQFDQLMTSNWLKYSPKEIFDIFPMLGAYSSKNKLCISNRIFDKYIDSLTDNVKSATDSDLTSIFYSLKKWPETMSVRTRNYIEVWAALDDECLKRIPQWSFNEMFFYLALFFMLNVTRVSDFSFKCLQKLASRAKQLTPEQVVQTMFYVGIYRKPPFDMHNLEVRIENVFSGFNIDELAIISMGFFKSKTPIRSMQLVSKIIDKIIENSKEVHEVSLASLLKVIRYSIKINIDDKVYEMLDAIQYEVPRVSVMCNVHIALVGTGTLTFHEDCLTKIADVINSKMSATRLKDLERLVLSYGTFNFIPKTKECIFTNVLNELRKSERESEIDKFGKSFICCVGYLGLLGFYPVDLINRALCPMFLERTYGKQSYAYGREVLIVNNIAKIFCKDFKVNLLNDKDINILSKKYTDYVPSENFTKQYNITERMFLDVMKILREARGGNEYITGHHILSHHQRGDIILCNDHNDRALPINAILDKKLFGPIYPPPNENKWIVFVIAGRNSMIYKSDKPTGHYQSKVRELNALGYHATLILWTVYSKCKTEQEKLNYFNNLIKMLSKNNNLEL